MSGLSVSHIEEARRRIAGTAIETELIPSPHLTARAGAAFLQHVEPGIGNGIERLVPGDTLPLTAAAPADPGVPPDSRAAAHPAADPPAAAHPPAPVLQRGERPVPLYDAVP